MKPARLYRLCFDVHFLKDSFRITVCFERTLLRQFRFITAHDVELIKQY